MLKFCGLCLLFFLKYQIHIEYTLLWDLVRMEIPLFCGKMAYETIMFINDFQNNSRRSGSSCDSWWCGCWNLFADSWFLRETYHSSMFLLRLHYQNKNTLVLVTTTPVKNGMFEFFLNKSGGNRKTDVCRPLVLKFQQSCFMSTIKVITYMQYMYFSPYTEYGAQQTTIR